MRTRRAVAAALVLAASIIPVTTAAPALAAACAPQPGVPERGAIPYAQTRLDFADAWGVTQGQGITVAVIDSGVAIGNPQMKAITYVNGISEVPNTQPLVDCIGHGTAVTGIIAAPKIPGTAFTGVAPGVQIMPIKQTNSSDRDPNGTARLVKGIEDAVAAKVKIINVSIASDPSPDLENAVRDAQAAGIIVVAAAGNDAQGNNGTPYPAGYSTEFDNVLAVAAVDQTDQVASFSDTGSFVNISAPGVGIEAPAPGSGYGFAFNGTSFATPFVTGTVALTWAAHPDLTAAQIVRRIEATADTPPDTVPSTRYGYGIVDPVRAVEEVREDAAASTTAPSTPSQQLPAPVLPKAHSATRDLGIGIAGALFGLTVLLLAVVALRRTTAGRPAPAPETPVRASR